MTWLTGRRTGLYRLTVRNAFGSDSSTVEIPIHGSNGPLPAPPGSPFTTRKPKTVTPGRIVTPTLPNNPNNVSVFSQLPRQL